MKKIIAVGFTLAALCFASCSTTGFAGLATESYAVEIEQKTQSELEEIRAELKKIRELTDTLESIVKDVEETKRTTRALDDRLGELDDKFDDIPRETIEKLVSILQAYLKEKK